MPGLHADYIIFIGDFNLEKLLKDVVPIFEIWVIKFKLQFDEDVVVFIVHQTKSISFKHLSVGHATITNIDLGPFRINILT
jgi:hypothetical protein